MNNTVVATSKALRAIIMQHIDSKPRTTQVPLALPLQPDVNY